MIQRRLVALLLSIVAAAGGFLLWTRPVSQADGKFPPTIVSALDQPTHPIRFYEEHAFMEGVQQTQGKTPATNYRIRGGILPHHTLPGFILSDFFARLGQQAPTTIIVIGPNHYESGHYPALSSRRGWETPFGTVLPNHAIIDDLAQRNLVQIDEVAVPNDHSTASSMPYIRYYAADATVVPIILSGKMSLADIDRLAERLTSYLDDKTVLVAPVDFSHYLTAKQAQANDRVTFEAMNSFAYTRLLGFNNDFVDSPVSIAVMLKSMQKIGATTSELLYNTNSGILAKNPTMQTTSYFSMLYH